MIQWDLLQGRRATGIWQGFSIQSRRGILRLLRRENNEFQSVKIHRHATIPADSGKVVALVGGSVPGHDRVALTDQVLHLFPDSFPHPAGIPADIDARPDLQQPHGKPAAKARRRVPNYDDHHRRCPPHP